MTVYVLMKGFSFQGPGTSRDSTVHSTIYIRQPKIVFEGHDSDANTDYE